ncbi:MAG: hypothetical protein M3096_05815 [Actinomycetia bacterium]|nr:hypothetical protein [Actinomycetes bacterium]
MSDRMRAYVGLAIAAFLFGAATAAVILVERLTLQGWIGAGLIMVGMYVVLAFSPPDQADLVAAESLSEAH